MLSRSREDSEKLQGVLVLVEGVSLQEQIVVEEHHFDVQDGEKYQQPGPGKHQFDYQDGENYLQPGRGNDWTDTRLDEDYWQDEQAGLVVL
jgi:hypothetical protein